MTRIGKVGMGLLTACAVMALFMSTFAVVKYTQTQANRERDRITSDVQGCERGNNLRQQIIDIAAAQEDLVDGILDTFLNPEDRSPQVQARIAALRDRLSPLFVKYEEKVAQIELVDCQARVPGAGG
jgi:hypothetical protein